MVNVGRRTTRGLVSDAATDSVEDTVEGAFERRIGRETRHFTPGELDGLMNLHLSGELTPSESDALQRRITHQKNRLQNELNGSDGAPGINERIARCERPGSGCSDELPGLRRRKNEMKKVMEL